MQSKIVEFQKIKVRNFLSYGDDPIEVKFKNGVTFITGYNKDVDSHNGVGKTSLIVESLSFLLFGETYRDINQKLIRNKNSNKTCIVEGWLKVNEDEIHVVRSLNPNKLILTVNGDSENYTKSIPETTKDIINRIGISKTIFTNTIVMTNNASMAFLNQKKEVKTKFVEGILGLESFTPFFQLAKDEYKLTEERKNKKFFEIQQLEREIQSDIEYYKREKEKNDREKEILVETIKSLKSVQPLDNSEEINRLTQEIQDLEKTIPDKEEKIAKGNKLKAEIDAEKSQKTKTYNILKGKPTECPSCKRPFDSHNKEQIEEEKKSLLEEINQLNEKSLKFQNALNKVSNEISQIKQNIQVCSRKIHGLNIEQTKFSRSQLEIESHTKELERKSNFTNPFTDKIKQSKERIKILNSEHQELSFESEIALIVKEAASPTGIKALVIKKIIDTLNNRINHYLVRLNSPFRVYFDEFFEETFFSTNNEEYCYGSLSGGEAKRVDFAMLFAFRDIRRLQSNVHINVTVMDELFDSALCEKGMQSILDVLKENTDECYMIVTHRASNIELSDCNVINLIKENGITRLNNQ